MYYLLGFSMERLTKQACPTLFDEDRIKDDVLIY